MIPSPLLLTLQQDLKTLEQESESGVSSFKQNEMTVNADKFQAIILSKKEIEATQTDYR